MMSSDLHKVQYIWNFLQCLWYFEEQKQQESFSCEIKSIQVAKNSCMI